MVNRREYSLNVLILFFCIVNSRICSAVIYELNDTEYNKMPPVFHVDPYEECQQDPGGVYCLVELALVSDGPSPLMDLITEYSAHTVCHYNHSLIRYNLCATRRCEEFHDNTTAGLVKSLEACLNKTFEDNYGLKTKLTENDVHCKKVNEVIKTEVADLCMYALMSGILVVNIIGSLYDFICTNGKKGEGISLLISFSIRRNWRKLVAPPLQGSDSRLERLKGLSFPKFVTTACVILAHTFICSVFSTDNPKFVETLYKMAFIQSLASATIVVQTFFLISGFLLSYNLELRSENTSFKVNWMLIPKTILLRWIRLAPPYLFLIFFTVTINKYIITGPHWHFAGIAEVIDCKKYWWQHLLYINNYNDHSQCLSHTWYLAADTQLYVLGLIIYVTCRSAVSRKVVIPLLMVVAIVIPVAHTYYQDLDGIAIASPEVSLHFFLTDPTFTHVYKRGHTNMFSYLTGLSIGFLAYYGQKVNVDVQKYKKYKVLFYCIIPLGLLLIWNGTIFFYNGPRPSLAVRMLFVSYQRPVWSFIFGIGMLAVFFRYEGVLRGLAEWRGWTTLSRLSYCAFCAHTPLLRTYVTHIELIHVTYISMIEHGLFIMCATYLISVPVWLLLEKPLAQLLSAFLRKPAKDALDNNTDVVKEAVVEQEKNNAFGVLQLNVA